MRRKMRLAQLHDELRLSAIVTVTAQPRTPACMLVRQPAVWAYAFVHPHHRPPSSGRLRSSAARWQTCLAAASAAASAGPPQRQLQSRSTAALPACSPPAQGASQQAE